MKRHMLVGVLLLPMAAAHAQPVQMEGAIVLRMSPEGHAIADALRKARSPLSNSEQDMQIFHYEMAAGHKSFAIASEIGWPWWSGWHENKEAARERTLEGCQLHAGKPCVTVAAGGVPGEDRRSQEREATRARKAAASPVPPEPPQDMPRLAYAGSFDPQRIPILRPAVRAHDDVKKYAGIAGAKAMAIHPGGHVFPATGQATQQAAASAALAACNTRTRINVPYSPCFLYALGNDVVLTKRLTAPE
jgi:pyruvate/2-oxoglutarate dehydrogenase complex dihydrolipoamide acyltransferase (E2) component